ncbi:hypothetical protein JEY40_31675 [Bradyrhizobium japonicum]|uniref:hypothetical protein n=1 Tax=Bradyrhizobium japonicum TaxID=375 RepID=UPI0020101B7B|nr:hypothetical protein [Bradyrhizobium japonicum]UQD70484.1 hypothetical protein JEY40_31675 [Bradyrhizobium japonicum]
MRRARCELTLWLQYGRKLATLHGAAVYITELPQAEHGADEWQTAMEALLLVAERNGPKTMARIVIMRCAEPA